MKSIVALPLEPEAFRPFGDVFEAPGDYRRVYVSDALDSGRAAARPSLSVLRVKPVITPTLVTTKMERHEFSSQSFVPRWTATPHSLSRCGSTALRRTSSSSIC